MAHNITVTSSSNGTTVPAPGTYAVPDGAGYLVQFAPLSEYRVSDVLVDGVSVGAVPQYQFTGVVGDRTLAVSYAKSHYNAVSQYTLSNLVDPVAPATTPQYSGIKLKFKVSTASVPSYATVQLTNGPNSLTFSWTPGTIGVAYATPGTGGQSRQACGNGPYWVEMDVCGATVRASVRGIDGVNPSVMGVLSLTGGNDIASDWVVTVDSSASGPGVNDFELSDYGVAADDKQSLIVVGAPKWDKVGKVLTVLDL